MRLESVIVMEVPILMLLAVLGHLVCTTAATSPNIVFILADDLGWNDVGFHGSEIKTPYLDKLAYEGLILTNYYVSPICTPTRGALMTGRYPIHLGLQHYVIAAPEPWGLPLHHTTMGEHFKRLGYATHIIGKWHLGFFRKEYLPTNRGFDSHFGYWSGREDYYSRIDADWHLGFFKSEYLPTRRGFDSHFGYWNGKEDYYDHINVAEDHYTGLDFRRNMEVVNKTGYSTEMYTSDAVDLINKHNKSEPLFLYMAQQATHGGNMDRILEAPQKYIDRFPYIENHKRRTYAGMAAALDDSVGAVERALRDNDMMDNTIIVFSTDNGGPVHYSGSGACNFPLRGSKETLFEGGVHGVGFVHSKLLKKNRTMTDSLMHVSDWLPTLYSAAGGNVADLGQLDGVDNWNMLRTNSSAVRKELLHNIDPIDKTAAIRVGDYKLLKGEIYGGNYNGWYVCTNPGGENDSHQYHNLTMLHKEDTPSVKRNKRFAPYSPYNVACGPPPINYTQNCQPQKAPCLFNIAKDPCEYSNLADEFPDIVQNLLKRLDEFSQTAVDPVNKPADPSANPIKHGGVWVPWDDE